MCGQYVNVARYIIASREEWPLYETRLVHEISQRIVESVFRTRPPRSPLNAFPAIRQTSNNVYRGAGQRLALG